MRSMIMMKMIIKIIILLIILINFNGCTLFKVHEIKENKIYKIFKNKYIL